MELLDLARHSETIMSEFVQSMRDTYYDDDGGSCRREIAVEKPFAFDYGPSVLQEPRHGALDPLQRTVLFQLEGWVDDLARFGIFSTSFKLNSRKRRDKLVFEPDWLLESSRLRGVALNKETVEDSALFNQVWFLGLQLLRSEVIGTSTAVIDRHRISRGLYSILALKRKVPRRRFGPENMTEHSSKRSSNSENHLTL
ncbi:hypothetical protein CIHG_03981 [Coccidioides immitis H538.4]|uniref:Uncharacterized protein n=3 Tax=Coccidioides immitis TaxID=5501 RepID=A0A0J8QR66_COCIT|nr:hypothetical protein CIRG_03731 [Coccidioides immitis RMSCC 2394]KMU75016.1 hypothetical protein CISG_00945 [Coccidioides immitis RMSCC 3703]KMU86193.1 hypothetical protein CIHG_03981 [Coccidioides immitis H538.4]